MSRGLENLTDLELLQLLKRHNSEAFEELYFRYKLPVFNYCKTMLKNNQEAEEITQNIWLRFLEYPDKFKFDSDRGTFKTYLFIVARSEIYRYFKIQKKNVHILIDELDDSDPVLIDETLPINKLLQDEFSNSVKEILNSLPERDREIIYLKDWLELTYVEIKKIYGIREDKLRKIVQRAREKFIKEINKISKV